jgi:hypothetical protein
MIIYGTTVIRRTMGEGQFNCPNCGGTHPYRHRKPTQFFTLYFIPLIPMGSGGEEYVECRTCSGAYTLGVLDLTERDYYLSYVNDLKWVMVVMACQHQSVTEEERESLRESLYQETGEPWDVEELSQQLEQGFEMAKQGTFPQFMAYICEGMNLEGRLQAVRCAFEAAMCSGELSGPRGEALQDLPAALGLTDEQFRAAIDDAA